jgi:hypothetical protein
MTMFASLTRPRHLLATVLGAVACTAALGSQAPNAEHARPEIP